MQNNTEQHEEDLVSQFEQFQVGFGLPTCACGACLIELAGADGVALISMETMRDWFLGECPGPAK